MHRKQLFLLTLILTAATTLFAAEDVLKWHKSPEAYFMTAEERAAWGKVASPDDARKFIDEYYRKRGEGFAKEVRTRIDLADRDFRIDKTPGSQTARGRVWMILGSPSRSRTNRTMETSPNLGGFDIPKKTIESQGLVETEWTYDANLLPAELGRKSLVVKFQTDSSRGYEAIENQGIVEPYLSAAAELLSKRAMATEQASLAQRSTLPSQQAVSVSGPDPLWNAAENLNGAFFTGESYLSPREDPFYAYSFYIPQSAAAFKDWNSALLVTLVRNAAGQQVIADRKQLDLGAYDDAGNRYVDRSVALAPGKYEGLFAVYTPDGATLLASHRANFEVAAKDAPRATALLLTSKIDTLENQDALDPFTFVATKYAVRADRRFRLSDKLAFFTVISNPSGMPEPKLMQKMIFKKDGAEFFRSPLEPVALTQTGPNTFLIGNAFDPATFPAGHYSLELQVRDMNAADGSDLRTKGYVLTSEFEVTK